MHISGIVVLALAALLVAGTVYGGTPAVGVERDGRRFAVEMSLTVEAPPGAVYAALSDYANWSRLNPAVERSEALPAPPGEQRVRSVTRACVLIFCGHIRQVQRVLERPPYALRAETLPNSGNLAYGEVDWLLAPLRSGTYLRMQAVVEPDFAVPPLIGTWAVRHLLSQQAQALAQALSRLAISP